MKLYNCIKGLIQDGEAFLQQGAFPGGKWYDVWKIENVCFVNVGTHWSIQKATIGGFKELSEGQEKELIELFCGKYKEKIEQEKIKREASEKEDEYFEYINQ